MNNNNNKTTTQIILILNNNNKINNDKKNKRIVISCNCCFWYMQILYIYTRNLGYRLRRSFILVASSYDPSLRCSAMSWYNSNGNQLALNNYFNRESDWIVLDSRILEFFLDFCNSNFLGSSNFHIVNLLQCPDFTKIFATATFRFV